MSMMRVGLTQTDDTLLLHRAELTALLLVSVNRQARIV